MTRHIPSPTPARAVAYVRVSTDKQADNGVSLEAQTAKVRAMADVQDAHLLEVITDAGVSTKALQRPGLARVLGLVRARAVDRRIGHRAARPPGTNPPLSANSSLRSSAPLQRNLADQAADRATLNPSASKRLVRRAATRVASCRSK